MKPHLLDALGAHLHPIVFDGLGKDSRPVAGTWRPGTGGDAIVFLHGLGCSRAMWEAIIDTADAITDKALPYSLYAIDFPGHGDTPPARHRRGLDAAMVHLVGVLAQIEAETIHLVAHSIAAAVCAAAVDARFLSGRIGTFISVEGNHIINDYGLVTRRIAAMSPEAFIDAGWAEVIADFDEADLSSDTWGRQWVRSDPATIHTMSVDAIAQAASTEPALFWHSVPRRAYLYGADSDISEATTAFLGTDLQISIGGSWHFPMVTNPAATFEAVISLVESSDERYRGSLTFGGTDPAPPCRLQ